MAMHRHAFGGHAVIGRSGRRQPGDMRGIGPIDPDLAGDLAAAARSPAPRHPSPRPRPAAGPAAHAAPPNRQTDQADRARAPIVLTFNCRFKRPPRRAASASRPHRTPQRT
jgi:hypothetical protein